MVAMATMTFLKKISWVILWPIVDISEVKKFSQHWLCLCSYCRNSFCKGVFKVAPPVQSSPALRYIKSLLCMTFWDFSPQIAPDCTNPQKILGRTLVNSNPFRSPYVVMWLSASLTLSRLWIWLVLQTLHISSCDQHIEFYPCLLVTCQWHCWLTEGRAIRKNIVYLVFESSVVKVLLNKFTKFAL